MKFELKT